MTTIQSLMQMFFVPATQLLEWNLKCCTEDQVFSINTVLSSETLETSYMLINTVLVSQGTIYRRHRAVTMEKASMSSQAVSGAVGHNPISIIIPCHRVVGASGSLTGYAGGMDAKVGLLTLEGVDMTSVFIPKIAIKKPT